MESILRLDREGLEQDIKTMREGLEAFNEAVKKINGAVDIAPEHWEGAASTAYMDQYNELRSTLDKDVPEAVAGMIDYMEGYLKSMMEADEEAAKSLKNK